MAREGNITTVPTDLPCELAVPSRPNVGSHGSRFRPTLIGATSSRIGYECTVTLTGAWRCSTGLASSPTTSPMTPWWRRADGVWGTTCASRRERLAECLLRRDRRCRMGEQGGDGHGDIEASGEGAGARCPPPAHTLAPRAHKPHRTNNKWLRIMKNSRIVLFVANNSPEEILIGYSRDGVDQRKALRDIERFGTEVLPYFQHDRLRRRESG